MQMENCDESSRIRSHFSRHRETRSRFAGPRTAGQIRQCEPFRPALGVGMLTLPPVKPHLVDDERFRVLAELFIVVLAAVV